MSCRINISSRKIFPPLPFISSAACLNWTLPRLRRTSAAIFIISVGARQFEFSLRDNYTDLCTFYRRKKRTLTDTSVSRRDTGQYGRLVFHEPHLSSVSASEWTSPVNETWYNKYLYQVSLEPPFDACSVIFSRPCCRKTISHPRILYVITIEFQQTLSKICEILNESVKPLIVLFFAITCLLERHALKSSLYLEGAKKVL